MFSSLSICDKPREKIWLPIKACKVTILNGHHVASELIMRTHCKFRFAGVVLKKKTFCRLNSNSRRSPYTFKGSTRNFVRTIFYSESKDCSEVYPILLIRSKECKNSFGRFATFCSKLLDWSYLGSIFFIELPTIFKFAGEQFFKISTGFRWDLH